MLPILRVLGVQGMELSGVIVSIVSAALQWEVSVSIEHCMGYSGSNRKTDVINIHIMNML